MSDEKINIEFDADLIRNEIRETLGLNEVKEVKTEEAGNEKVNEAYVIQARHFNLPTDKLSTKTKVAHQELLDGYVGAADRVSAELDTASRENANLNHSNFRSLKIDEAYNVNAAFLHGLYFENISDLSSSLAMDSLTYLRLERDFGSFDKWQEDFIACCMSARNGWAITAYNVFLKRYVNMVVDLHSLNVMVGTIPVIIMDVWEHAYYRDYLKNRKAYVFAMMRQLNWSVIEDRIKATEKVAKVYK